MQALRSAALAVFLVLVCVASMSVCDADGSVGLRSSGQAQGISSHPSILTTWVFPDAPTRRFKSAQPQDALVGFSNTHEAKRFNVSRIFGWLAHSSDPSIIMQNFSAFGYGFVVNPSQTQTFLYKFYVDPMLEPHDFSMTLIVNYHDGPNSYYSIAFNGTVFVEDEEEPVTGLELLSVFIIIALVGFFGFALHKKTKAQKPGKSAKSPGASTSPVQLQEEWLPPHVLKHAEKKKQK